MWSLDTLLRILVEPAGYFRDRREDCAFSMVASFCMIHAVVLTAVGFAAGLMGTIAAGAGPSSTLDIARTLSIMALYMSGGAVAALVLTVIAAAIIHPLVLLVGGRYGYQATYGAVVYSIAPASLLFVLALHTVELMPGSEPARITSNWLIAAGVVWSLAVFAIGIFHMQSLAPIGGIIVGAAPIAAVAACVAWMAQPTNMRERGPIRLERYLSALPFGDPIFGRAVGPRSAQPKAPASISKKSAAKARAEQRRVATPRPRR